MRQFWVVSFLLSYISIASVSSAMITPALPIIEQSYALMPGKIEYLVSIFLLGYVLGQLAYGPIANTKGRLKALNWGLNINLMGLILCYFASYQSSFLLLLLGRFITGLGSAAGLSCTFMLINEWLPESSRKSATAYSILSFALGIGLAVFLGALVTQYISWRACFIVLLFQGLIMRYGTQIFSETLKAPERWSWHGMLLGYKKALISPKLLIFSVVWGVCTSVGYCYSAAAPQIAQEYLGLDVAEYGYWNGLTILGMLLGGISSRYLMEKWKTFQVLLFGYGVAAVLLVFLYLMQAMQLHSPFLFFFLCALLYCFSAYLYAGGAYLASTAIDDKASASSMMSFVNMMTATLAVSMMAQLSADPFKGFIEILSLMLILTFFLMLGFIKAR